MVLPKIAPRATWFCPGGPPGDGNQRGGILGIWGNCGRRALSVPNMKLETNCKLARLDLPHVAKERLRIHATGADDEVVTVPLGRAYRDAWTGD